MLLVQQKLKNVLQNIKKINKMDLPKGYQPINWTFIDLRSILPSTSQFEYEGSPWLSGEWADPDRIILNNRSKCQCGTTKVIKVEEDDWTFHSTWCPINESKLDVRINPKK